MNPFFSAIALLALATPLSAAPLSEPERQALLEQLDTLRDEARTKVESKFEGAEAAFRSGMASEEAAVALFLKCVEKVRFQDQNRDPQEFREWKRRNKDALQAPSFTHALRHQLRWLSLSMRAATAKDPSSMAPAATEAINSIFAHAAILNPGKDQIDRRSPDYALLIPGQERLRQNVAECIYAEAYQLTHLKPDKWPLAPLPCDKVYSEVILPPLRSPEHVDELRSAWLDRIRSESIAAQDWSGNGERGTGDPEAPEVVKFLSETKPDLEWQMAVDLFRAGDEKKSALLMLQHLQKHLSHTKAPEWEASFRILVDPPKPAGETALKEDR